MRLWVGNEPRHKTRGIRGFILFHSILHGRQPPREYGIKLLRRLTKDDEIETVEKAGAAVDIGKFPRPKEGERGRGDTCRITKWRARAAIKYRSFLIHMRARISYVSRVRRTEFDVIVLRMPIRATVPFVKATPNFANFSF